MKKGLMIGLFIFYISFTFGCAEKVYLVTEAKAVTQKALEPVTINSQQLVKSLKNIGRQPLATTENVETIMSYIREYFEKSKRFTSVLVLGSDGISSVTEGYVIFPEIISINFKLGDTYDPERKRYIITVRARMKIYDAGNMVEEIATYNAENKRDKKGNKSDKLTKELENELIMESIRIAFLDLSYQLGDDFNPSYEMGTIEKISGNTVYVKINTSKLVGVKPKDRSVDVIDDENKVLASVEVTSIGDGVISGQFYKKADASIKTGMTVRARTSMKKR